MHFRIPTILFLLILIACHNNNDFKGTYNLNKIEEEITLDKILKEISGMTLIDNSTIGCIQDEKGIIFTYDLRIKKITNQYNFNIDGDYEGLARVKKDIYVLRSDGTIFRISNFESSNFKVDSFKTKIPAENNEGLCYDKANNRLLIGCKGRIGKGVAFKDLRAVYGFDLATKKTSREAVFNFNVQDLKNYAIEHKIKLPMHLNKKGVKEPVIKFMISEIALHPFTKQLYLLSANDYLFFIFNMNGEVEHIEALNPKTFNKSEGLTFLNNGDMLISNEGQNKKPTLLRFKNLSK